MRLISNQRKVHVKYRDAKAETVDMPANLIPLPDMTVSLKKAVLSDAVLIGSLARKIWLEHYIEVITIEQIEYMLQKMYSEDSITNQITNEGCIFYLVISDDSTVGFISVTEKEKDHWFLNKFYIDNRGKGLGTVAFNKLLETINPKEVTLTVNRHNYKSINFYFKNNFIIKEVADFDIGNGFVMNDFVMLWKRR